MKPYLTILTVNNNSADFVLNALFCLKKLTKNPYQVFILDNNSIINDYQKLSKAIKIYPRVYLKRVKIQSTGSQAHGEALNLITKNITTPYFCILDPDAVWLKKHWDDFLISNLNQKIKIIGTPRTASKNEVFPVAYAMLLETKSFNKIRPDFMPGNITKGQDTGWRLKSIYHQAGLKGKVFTMKNTRFEKTGYFYQVICAEYYFKEQLIASHFSRGSTLGSSKYNKNLYKIPLIGSYLKKRNGIIEKKLWIKLCQDYVGR